MFTLAHLGVICAATVALVAGCGEDRIVEESQIPPRLAGAVPSLERAGYRVEAVTTATEVPVLIAREGEVAAAVTVAATEDLPLEIRDESGNSFPVNESVTCNSGITVAHAAQDGRIARDMARAAC